MFPGAVIGGGDRTGLIVKVALPVDVTEDHRLAQVFARTTAGSRYSTHTLVAPPTRSFIVTISVAPMVPIAYLRAAVQEIHPTATLTGLYHRANGSVDALSDDHFDNIRAGAIQRRKLEGWAPSNWHDLLGWVPVDEEQEKTHDRLRSKAREIEAALKKVDRRDGAAIGRMLDMLSTIRKELTTTTTEG